MDILSAIILGVVQGITEFLPVSSSGHLVLVREFLDINDINALAVDSVLHLATTIAIIIYFWGDIWVLIQTVIRKLGRLPTNDKDLTLLYSLLIATVPGVILGLLLESFMNRFESAQVVASILFASAVFFMYAEWRYYLSPPQGGLTLRRAFLVGCFQALALVPGFSRSGATLAGGMLLGLSRIESARFSFLLAIPITLGVGLKKLLELMGMEQAVNWGPILIGAVVSFLLALVMIHFFLAFIRKHTLWPFIWYSIALSGAVWYVSVLV